MAEREEFKRIWKSVMDLGACVRVGPWWWCCCCCRRVMDFIFI